MQLLAQLSALLETSSPCALAKVKLVKIQAGLNGLRLVDSCVSSAQTAKLTRCFLPPLGYSVQLGKWSIVFRLDVPSKSVAVKSDLCRSFLFGSL